MKIVRLPPAEERMMVPEPIDEHPGRVTVDSTWGKVQPIALSPDVRTVGEIEVIEQIESGRPLIDCRLAEYYAQSTIPEARSIPHVDIIERIEELGTEVPNIFFCNGPQCPATPDAISQMLAAGFPARSILYYRGGMHDWITLGLPVTKP